MSQGACCGFTVTFCRPLLTDIELQENVVMVIMINMTFLSISISNPVLSSSSYYRRNIRHILFKVSIIPSNSNGTLALIIAPPSYNDCSL
jgi:hypothetical protein